MNVTFHAGQKSEAQHLPTRQKNFDKLEESKEAASRLKAAEVSGRQQSPEYRIAKKTSSYSREHLKLNFQHGLKSQHQQTREKPLRNYIQSSQTAAQIGNQRVMTTRQEQVPASRTSAKPAQVTGPVDPHIMTKTVTGQQVKPNEVIHQSEVNLNLNSALDLGLFQQYHSQVDAVNQAAQVVKSPSVQRSSLAQSREGGRKQSHKKFITSNMQVSKNNLQPTSSRGHQQRSVQPYAINSPQI